MVEAEKEALLARCHLQKRHLMVLSSSEGWSCLGVYAKDVARQEIVYGTLGLVLVEHDCDFTWKRHQWQSIDCSLVEFIVYCFLHLALLKELHPA